MKCIIDIVLLLSRQGCAFWGHRENDTSDNKGNKLINYYIKLSFFFSYTFFDHVKINLIYVLGGNFKELCELMSKYYPEFKNKYFNKLTNHTSWLIQNDLINICAENVKSIIINEIQESRMFSIVTKLGNIN